MTKKRWMIAAAVLALLVAVSIALALAVLNSSRDGASEAVSVTPPVSSQTQEAPTSGKLSQENVTLLETSLNGSSKTEQAKALVPEMRSAEWNPEAIVPNGAKLTIDRNSFVVDSQREQLGTMRATVTGSAQGEFLLRLMRQPDGVWLVFQTEQTQ